MPRAKKVELHPAEQYAADVLSGKIVANKWVKLACERQKKNLEGPKDHTFPYRFDRDRAQKAIDFYKFTRHSKGEWARQIIKPEPWQQFIEWCVYGWVKISDGTRRFTHVYEEVARKNGKTTRQSKNGLFQLMADGEDGAECYVGATKLRQSMICFEEAQRMALSSPSLKKRLHILKHSIAYPETWSKFEPLGQDSESLDGLNVSCAILDELHAHKSREMYDLLDTATGTRRQALIWAITTAGKDQTGLCWDLRSYTLEILKGTITDESWFGIIFCIDDEDNWEDETCWVKANPNLGVSCKLEDLQKKANRAKHSPLELSKFLRLHLGRWTSEAEKLLPEADWAACSAKVDLEALREKKAKCFLAFDLANRVDLVSLVSLFPEKGRFKIVPQFWIPEEAVDDTSRGNRDMIKKWVQQGFIQTTPGRSIKQKYILQAIKEQSKQFRVLEVLGDPWNAAFMMEKLIDAGISVTVFDQTIRNFTAPTKKLVELTLEHKLEHGGHPVLAWMAGNVKVITDANENIRPTKKKSAGKIDGIVALIMTIGGFLNRFAEIRASKDPNQDSSFRLMTV